MRKILTATLVALLGCTGPAQAEPATQVLDIPTRENVSVRSLVLMPQPIKAAAILLAGGDGGLKIFPGGSIGRLESNFLIRSRGLFAEHGIATASVDAPSDRMRPPYLSGFRTTDEHVRDLGAVLDRLADMTKQKVWLVGTSRGTQSAAFAGIRLKDNPNIAGIVLTSSILVDSSSRPVPAMPLETLGLPVLVVHHDQDSCRVTLYSDLPLLVKKLNPAARQQVIIASGGVSTGDPCHAQAYHGYNGREAEVVKQISEWMLGQ